MATDDNHNSHESDSRDRRSGTQGIGRRKLLTMAGTGTGIALTGCLGGGGGGDNNDSSGGTANSSGGGSTQLKMLSALASYPGYKKAWQKQLDAFESEFGVKVTLDVTGFGDLLTKATQAAAGGSPYDVIDVPGSSNLWTLQQKGVIQPVSDVIQDLGTSYFYEQFIDYNKHGGEYWGVPIRQTGLVQWSRKDWYDKAGLDHPTGTDTLTWDEYRQAVETFAGSHEGVAGNVIALGSSYFPSTYPFSLLNSNGGRILDKNGEVAFDSKETRQTLEFVKELYGYSPSGSSNYTAGDLRSIFINEKSAHTFYSSFLLPSDIENQNPGMYGKADIFAIPTRTKSQTPTARLAGEHLVVSKGIDNPEMAKKLVKYLLDLDNVIDFYHGNPTSSIVTVKPVLEERKEEFFAPDIYSKYEDVYIKYNDITQKYGKPVVMENDGVLTPKTAQIMGDLVWMECLQEVCIKNKPIDETVTTYAKKMQEYV